MDDVVIIQSLLFLNYIEEDRSEDLFIEKLRRESIKSNILGSS